VPRVGERVAHQRRADKASADPETACTHEVGQAAASLLALGPLGQQVPLDGLAAAAIELGLVDELRMFRNPIVVGGGTPFLPPVTEDVRLDLVETKTFGSRVIYERYRRARDESD